MDKHGRVPGEVNPRDVVLKMQLEYSRGVKDHTTRLLEAIDALLLKLNRPDLDAHTKMMEVTELITRHLGITSVAIAVWDPIDGLFKYTAVSGLDKETADGFKNLVYTREQIDNPPYPSYAISRHTRLYLSEDHPYTEGEEFSYKRPGLLGMRRRSVTDSLEADYLCTFFRDRNEQISGWMDISGTRLRKMPDATTIRWIELISSVLCTALARLMVVAREE